MPQTRSKMIWSFHKSQQISKQNFVSRSTDLQITLHYQIVIRIRMANLIFSILGYKYCLGAFLSFWLHCLYAADVAPIIHPYHYRTIYQANFDLRVPVKKKACRWSDLGKQSYEKSSGIPITQVHIYINIVTLGTFTSFQTEINCVMICPNGTSSEKQIHCDKWQ